jgi:hypothetical protein
VEILSKTGGLNLLFCKPGTYLCLLFFIFCFDFKFEISKYNRKVFEGRGVDLEASGFGKGYGFLKQKKEILNLFRLFFCFKKPYSFLDLILWV